jgi:hypothetical protein
MHDSCISRDTISWSDGPVFVPVSLDAAADDIILRPDGFFHPTDQGQTKLEAAVLADCRQHSRTC